MGLVAVDIGFLPPASIKQEDAGAAKKNR